MARLPRKTAPTATPPATVPARNRASPAWDRAATIRASAARNMPRPASTTRRLLNRASSTWVAAPIARSRNTTPPCTAWLLWCSTVPRKVGASPANSPSKEKAANPARPAATNSPPPFGDAQAREAEGWPLAWADRFGNQEQGQARGRQHHQVHLEHQGGRVGGVLG